MKKSNALTIAALLSSAMAFTAGPGIAQNRDHQTKVVQNTRTAETSRHRSSGNASFNEYMRAQDQAHKEKAKRVNERQEFEEKYLESGE